MTLYCCLTVLYFCCLFRGLVSQIMSYSADSLQPREADWECRGCHFTVFGSKRLIDCPKCHLPRGSLPGSVGVLIKTGDWNCPKCNYHLFAKKTHCAKCKVDRDGNPVTTPAAAASSSSSDSTLCIVCMDSPRDCIFTTCRHVAVCIGCAEKLSECPVCKKALDPDSRQQIYLC
jgi:hypothetical protein